MSKAARIRDLLAQGMTPATIAAEVGCLSEYVQSVKQRARCPKSMRPCDVRWQQSAVYKAGRNKHWRGRYASDPAFRQRHLDRSAAAYARRRARKAEARAP